MVQTVYYWVDRSVAKMEVEMGVKMVVWSAGQLVDIMVVQTASWRVEY
jgi:hypothetical protein